MTEYEILIAHADEQGIYVLEISLYKNTKGKIYGNCILIESSLTTLEKIEVLEHELTHFNISPAKNLTEKNQNNLKFEWKVEITTFQKKLNFGNVCTYLQENPYIEDSQIAESLNMTLEFYHSAMSYYKFALGDKYYNKMIFNIDE